MQFALSPQFPPCSRKYVLFKKKFFFCPYLNIITAQDIVPVSTRRRVFNTVHAVSSFTRFVFNFVGGAAWILASSIVIVTLPLGYGIILEQQLVDAEASQKSQEQQAQQVYSLFLFFFFLFLFVCLILFSQFLIFLLFI